MGRKKRIKSRYDPFSTNNILHRLVVSHIEEIVQSQKFANLTTVPNYQDLLSSCKLLNWTKYLKCLFPTIARQMSQLTIVSTDNIPNNYCPNDLIFQ